MSQSIRENIRRLKSEAISIDSILITSEKNLREYCRLRNFSREKALEDAINGFSTILEPNNIKVIQEQNFTSVLTGITFTTIGVGYLFLDPDTAEAANATISAALDPFKNS